MKLTGLVPLYKSMRSQEIERTVKPAGATFCVLIRLIDLFDNDILFQCEVRNCA